MPAAPMSSRMAIAEAVEAASCTGLGVVVEHRVRQRPDCGESEEHRHHDAPVTDAVGDEGLLAGRRRRLAGVPERDEEVRAGTDALPTEERDQQVLAEHQDGHREHEEAEVEEELRELRVAVHVADGEQEDPAGDERDEQAHQDRQRIREEREVDLERADGHPGEQRDDVLALLLGVVHEVEVDERRRR